MSAFFEAWENFLRGPGYWQDETTGVLRPAVIAYLRQEPMTAEHIAAMRAYLRQWINAPVWDQNPYATATDRAELARLRRLVDHIESRVTIAAWMAAAENIGIDPL